MRLTATIRLFLVAIIEEFRKKKNGRTRILGVKYTIFRKGKSTKSTRNKSAEIQKDRKKSKYRKGSRLTNYLLRLRGKCRQTANFIMANLNLITYLK